MKSKPYILYIFLLKGFPSPQCPQFTYLFCSAAIKESCSPHESIIKEEKNAFEDRRAPHLR